MTEAIATQHASRLSRRYTLLEKLGVGGQGEVWRARDEAQGADVALKLLSPTLAGDEAAWAQFEREHNLASRLEHRGILRVHSPQREGEFAVLPMDLARGGDLRRLRGAGYLDIVPVLIEVAEALEHAHERGVIHRDLKPGNVLFGDDGQTLLADFGIAGVSQSALREGTKPALSPFSASPQQLRGEPPAIADDIYGLGALAYELLSGYPPFYPRFEIRRVMEEPVADLKTPHPVPPQLANLVMRMLAKDPLERPKSMREIIDVLDSALNDTLTFDFDKVSTSPRRGAPVLAPQRPVVTPILTPPPLPEPAYEPQRVVSRPAYEPVEEPSAAEMPPPPRPAAARQNASPWDDLKFDVKPRLMRLEPERAQRWPWVVLVLLATLAFGVFFWLPRYAPPEWLAAFSGVVDPVTESAVDAVDSATEVVGDAKSALADTAAGEADETALNAARDKFNKKLDALETRAAGVWGGADFANAKARAAEAVGADDAGNQRLAAQRMATGLGLLEKVEQKAPQALAAQLAEGDRAFENGQREVASQAYSLAKLIDPRSARAAQGLRRVGSLGGVLPLLADGQNAEAAKDHARAVKAYTQALSLDPANREARAGLDRARGALGENTYAKAVGSGFAALGAGRLEQARSDFEKARSIRPGGAEAANGLARVGNALSARGYSFTRQRGAALETEERWSEALDEYEAALKLDPSLAFAQQGKIRTAERAQFASALQALIDEPERLAAPSVRAEADALIQRANAIPNAGPVLRSQVARLQILLPEFDKPVRLALVSDNATQVAIQRVGEFGSFDRREIELRPGKYTVLGRREGFRDVRRDITIAPGTGTGQVQTISVSCVEPI